MVFLRRAPTVLSTPPSSPTLSDFSHASSSSCTSGTPSSPSTDTPGGGTSFPFPSFFPQDGSSWALAAPLVSPSLFLTCARCPSSPTDLLLRDAQSDRAVFVARGVYDPASAPSQQQKAPQPARPLHHHQRPQTTVLVQGVEFSWQALPDGSSAWGPTPPLPSSSLSLSSSPPREFVLFESPPHAPGLRRPARLAPLAVVTDESLRLRMGREVEWRKFYKGGWFASPERRAEGSWKDDEGRRYKWKKGAEGLMLFDCKTKEAVAAVRLDDNEPTQIVLSAYVLPSLHLVLCTLLHRILSSLDVDAVKQQLDRTEWWEEEGRAW
ncbi:hypothetical protein JCM6882_008938 [Rhodosporidiobolus microsporus]